MKLTISTPGNQYTADIEDREAAGLFNELVSIVINKELPSIKVAPVQPYKETCADTKEETTVQTAAHGFLILQCEECHTIKALYTASGISKYHCKKCGHKQELPGTLRPAACVCRKCGRHTFYRTNAAGAHITIPCFECSKPVSLTLDKARGIYKSCKAKKPDKMATATKTTTDNRRKHERN